MKKHPPLYKVLEVVRFRPFFTWLYRIEIRDRERIPASGPVILCSNHESMIDPWVLALATPRPIRYMAKQELWNVKALRWIMDAFGTFPVARGSGDTEAVGRAVRLLADGEALGIFPQGTCLPFRSRPFHRGAARLALASGAPIVPIAMVGTEKALRPGKFKLGRPRITVLVGEPIAVEPGRPTIAAAKDLTARIEAAITALRDPFGPPAHAWYEEELAA